MGNSVKANRLIDESSPYLLQHAHNPVDCIPGVMKLFKKPKRKINLFSSPADILLANGATIVKDTVRFDVKSDYLI